MGSANNFWECLLSGCHCCDCCDCCDCCQVVIVFVVWNLKFVVFVVRVIIVVGLSLLVNLTFGICCLDFVI